MQIVKWLVIALLAVAIGIFAAQYLASERVEVVVLETLDSAGKPQQTRVWVVDHEGLQYLRTDATSGWYKRLVAKPEVKVERNGVQQRYLAVSRPDKVDTIEQLMRSKYTWGDEVISLMLGEREAIAVELQPIDANPEALSDKPG